MSQPEISLTPDSAPPRGRLLLFSLLMPRSYLSPRELFQCRFMIGANLLGLLVGVPALIVSGLDGQMASIFFISSFMVALLGLLASLRLGLMNGSKLIWSELGVLAVFLTLQSLSTVEFEPVQLQWFLLLPFAAMVLMDPQQHRSGIALPIRPVLLASIVAIVLGVLVILAKMWGISFGGHSAIDDRVNAIVNFGLFMLAMCGLIYLYDSSLRETFAELEALRKLIPVCAWCKEIKEDEGYWMPIDQYVAKHYGEITHGICPSCTNKHFGNAPGYG